MSNFSSLHEQIRRDEEECAHKRHILRDLDLFVLDNSLRESTVGQMRGHTLQDKMSILEEVRKCGFTEIIVSAFSHAPRVDDEFVEKLVMEASKEEMKMFYAFSELGDGGDMNKFPISLQKMEKYGLQNPIIEVDLARGVGHDYATKVCTILQKRIDYTFKTLSPNAKIFVNFRDFPFAMKRHPDRVFEVVEFLSNTKSLCGIMFEEPTGHYLPELVGSWTNALRTLMDKCGWRDGNLLAHVHKKWAFAESVQLECLMSGANGVWASVCEEGAALGHACSTVSIMNLVRMNNTKVLKKFNCTYLRDAAINVTRHTTRFPPHPKQVVYGARALDLVFDFGGIAGGKVGDTEFDLANFFGVKAPKRITSLAPPRMIRDLLVETFGEDKQFTDEIARKMKDKIIEDLNENRKEEYMSAVGLAILFDRAGGALTAEMSEEIAKVELKSSLHHQLINVEVRAIWDDWDSREKVEFRGDESLEFYSFYNAFMSPYFGCYECEDSKKGLQAIDMDEDDKVDWCEFCVYLKWAVNQYSDQISNVEDLLTVAFQKGLIPAMQDEIIKANSAKIAAKL